MDRISELPQFIIHQILSNLSTKEAAQTSVLSKTWLQASSTSPILKFYEYDFSDKYRKFEEYNRHDFFSFVNNTLLRYRTHNLRIHKFDIRISGSVDHDHASAYRLLDQSIGTALDHGVKELHILNITSDELSSYTLPQTIFSTSAKALTHLSLKGCEFPQNFAPNIAIRFPFLKALNLSHTNIDDGMLQKLLSSCPSVECIFFHCVSGFKKFLVSNLGELKILNIISPNEVIEVDIQDAPSLHFLYSCQGYLQVGSVQSLKHLHLRMLIVTDSFLSELITKLPLLEVLILTICNGFQRINVSGRSLTHMLLEDCKDLVEANIDAPNLLTLKYKGYRALSLSLVNTREKLMTYIDIARSNFGDITWFHQLRELLNSVSRAQVSFDIWRKGVSFDTYLDPIANPLPLENFKQEINQSSSVFAAFVDTLFSGSRPTTISTQRGLFTDHVSFIKFLGNNLIMATRNSNCCSSDEETKCWRHYLKDIKVEVYENSQNAWQPHPWETLLEKPKFRDEQIRFSLKWNANLNAPY